MVEASRLVHNYHEVKFIQPEQPCGFSRRNEQLSFKHNEATPTLHSKTTPKGSSGKKVVEMNNFQYQPLDKGAFAVRLVSILPGTEDEPLALGINHTTISEESTPVYMTLSYVWGATTDKVPVSITACNGNTTQSVLHITPNLFQAIRHLQKFMKLSIPIWIDAICINQSDNLEKALQIPRMGDIYRLANRVIVWLGEGGTTGEYAIKLLKSRAEGMHSFAHFVNLEDDPKDPDNTDPCVYYTVHYDAFYSLLHRPWFDRLWIRQEIALANSEAVMVCGHEFMPWRDFVDASIGLRELAVREDRGLEVQARCVLVIELNGLTKQGGNLEYMLRVSRRAKCFDARDKIYGLLSLAEEYYQGKVTVDYDRPVLDLYREVLEIEVQRGRLSMLEHCDVSAWNLDWPSWIPDWANDPCTGYLSQAFSNGGLPAHVEYPDQHTLRATGLSISTIQTVLETLFRTDESNFNYEIFRLARQIITGDSDTDDNNDRLDAFCRTLCTNNFADSNRSSVPSLDEAKTHVKIVLETSGKPTSIPEYRKLARQVLYSCNRRSLIVTEHGNLGLAPARAQPGDIVCVLFGCPAPLALRTKGENKYEVVGQCFVDGIMNDEAVFGELPGSVGYRPCRLEGTTAIYEYFDKDSAETLPEDPRLSDFRDKTKHFLRETSSGHIARRYEWVGDVTLKMLKDAGLGAKSFDLV
jgi:hypothetical protein